MHKRGPEVHGSEFLKCLWGPTELAATAVCVCVSVPLMVELLRGGEIS